MTVRARFAALTMVIVATIAAMSSPATATTPYNNSAHCSEGSSTNATVTIYSTGVYLRTCRISGGPFPGVYHGDAVGSPHIYRQVLGGTVYCNYICSAYWFNSSNGWFTASATGKDHI